MHPSKCFVIAGTNRAISGIACKTQCSRINYGDTMTTLKQLKYFRTLKRTSSANVETIKDKLIGRSYYEIQNTNDKKTKIVGASDAAAAAVFTLLAEDVTKNVCMIDKITRIDDKMHGEQLDMEYGAELLNQPNIVTSKDYAVSAGSNICVYDGGSERMPVEDDSEHIYRNVAKVRHTVPELVKYSPEAVYLMTSDPNEILAYQASKASGLSTSKVIRNGTNLDSAKFQHLLVERFGMSATGCSARAAGKCGKPENQGTLQKLIQPVQPTKKDCTTKVTVVGCGQVGMAVVLALLGQNVTNHIAIVDLEEKKLLGETLDMQHGSVFLNNPIIESNKDYCVSADSRVCIVTAGARPKNGETRLDLVQRNADVIKTIIPQLVRYSPEAILILASNPVDAMSWVSWKLSGLPHQRVIGCGTNLDSARFRFLLSQRLGVAPSSVQAFIIGEHGNSMVPLWSSVSIAGVRLADVHPQIGTKCDPENWNEQFQRTVNSGPEIRSLKGATWWAVGLSLVHITNAILSNNHSVQAVSINVKGIHCVQEDVYISLPVVIGRQGVCEIFRQPLTQTEYCAFRQSVDLLLKIQQSIKL